MAIGSPGVTRHVALEGPVNVRDLGGYQGRAGQTLRWQRLFRADDLSRATERDRAQLTALGIATIIDLRTEREHGAARLPILPGAAVEIHHLPMVRDGWWDAPMPVQLIGGTGLDDVLAQRSLDMLVEGAPAIADALRILAQPGAQPAVIHSTLGKDRAGLLAAVVLALLGVPTPSIAEDYALSSMVLAGDEQRRCANGRSGPGWSADPVALAAPPASMVRVLDQVSSQCGSMVGFARGIGVEFEVIEALHRQLLG